MHSLIRWVCDSEILQRFFLALQNTRYGRISRNCISGRIIVIYLTEKIRGEATYRDSYELFDEDIRSVVQDN